MWLLTAVMVPIVSALMIVHFLEVFVWALAYLFVDATPAGHDVLYFAFVNYTTLGYGDITPVKRWNLLGPLTAMNGVLLFGWSTAFIYAVLRRVLAHIIPDISTPGFAITIAVPRLGMKFISAASMPQRNRCGSPANQVITEDACLAQ